MWFLAAAMAIGYLVGSLSVTLGGIPFSLGTSAGCIMAGVFVSYLRGRNPEKVKINHLGIGNNYDKNHNCHDTDH